MDGNGGGRSGGASSEPSAGEAGALQPQRIVVVARPGTGRRAREVVRWLRWLVPAAVLFVTPVPLPPGSDSAVSIDVEEVESGPLSLADALLRDRGGESR